MIPPFCWILLHDILQWPSPGYWDLTPWALLSTTSSGTFRKAAPKMSVPRSSFLLQTDRGCYFFRDKIAVFRWFFNMLRCEIPYVFHLDVMKTHPWFSRNWQLESRFQPRKCWRSGLKQRQEMAVWQRIFPFIWFSLMYLDWKKARRTCSKTRMVRDMVRRHLKISTICFLKGSDHRNLKNTSIAWCRNVDIKRTTELKYNMPH